MPISSHTTGCHAGTAQRIQACYISSFYIARHNGRQSLHKEQGAKFEEMGSAMPQLQKPLPDQQAIRPYAILQTRAAHALLV